MFRFLVIAQVIFILIHIFSFKFVQQEIRRLIILFGLTTIVIFCLHLVFVKILNDEFVVQSFYSTTPVMAFDESKHYAIIYYVCFLILAFVNGMIFLFILYHKCKKQKEKKFTIIYDSELKEVDEIDE